MKLELYLASDHARFMLKNDLVSYIRHEYASFCVEDLGPYKYDKYDDYPDYAAKLAKKIQGNSLSRGILVCGSGQGMCRVANKFKGISAALAWNEESARTSKEHSNANVLCLGARFTDHDAARAIVDMWVRSAYQGGRHDHRIEKIIEIEKENMK